MPPELSKTFQLFIPLGLIKWELNIRDFIKGWSLDRHICYISNSRAEVKETGLGISTASQDLSWIVVRKIVKCKEKEMLSWSIVFILMHPAFSLMYLELLFASNYYLRRLIIIYFQKYKENTNELTDWNFRKEKGKNGIISTLYWMVWSRKY